MPQSVKDSGVLPEGYCIGMSLVYLFLIRSQLDHHLHLDFIIDPITFVHSFAKTGVKYERYDTSFLYSITASYNYITQRDW